MSKTYNFALIGVGAVSSLHATAIKNLKRGNLYAVCGNNYDDAKKFALQNNCKAYETVEELLNDNNVDVVSICTPSGLHSEIAVKVANAKKHIVIEKPMAITESQISDIISAVDKNGVKCAVISQFRFSNSVQTLKSYIDSGKLGKIYHADFKLPYYRGQDYYDKGAWRGTKKMDGGGALMNQGVHGVDVIQYLMGGIKSVYADCRTMGRNIEVEDTANVLVEYENGAIGVIQATTLAYKGFSKTIEITAEKGSVVIKEDSIEVWDVLGEEGKFVDNSTVIKAGADPMAIPYTYHLIQFNDLIDAIENNREPILSERQGEIPVKVVLAIYQSSKEGKKVYINENN
jgi:predicted dehydrogenase